MTNYSKDKSLEVLENDVWEFPESFPTDLVKNVFLARQKAIKDLEARDVRLLISQNVGLKYLVPVAIDFLKEDVFLEALYYPGDLLEAVLRIDMAHWENYPADLDNMLILLAHANRDDTDQSHKAETEDVFEAINRFVSIRKKHNQ